jgi:enoyl-CoA hydratase/carnithine racemase
MLEQEVLVEDRGHVRWLMLNRPEAMNSITGDDARRTQRRPEGGRR